MGKIVQRWLDQLVRRGLRRGLLEGSDIWLVAGALAWLARLLWRKPEAKVQLVRLRLGEAVTVRHVAAPPRSRRDKRDAARRAARALEPERRRARRTRAERSPVVGPKDGEAPQ